MRGSISFSLSTLYSLLSFDAFNHTDYPAVAPKWRILGGFLDETHVFVTTKCPIASASIFVRMKQSIASAGVHTIGSFSLNDVLRITGVPVRSPNALISAQYSGACWRSTVC